jgi:hypothetical protein
MPDPPGYECVSGSAEGYPLLTGDIGFAEVTSDHLSQPQFSHKNPPGADGFRNENHGRFAGVIRTISTCPWSVGNGSWQLERRIMSLTALVMPSPSGAPGAVPV